MVKMQTVSMRSNQYAVEDEVTPRQAPREASRFFSVFVSHSGKPTSNMTTFMPDFGDTPEAGTRYMETAASRYSGPARAVVHSEFETDNGFVHVSDESGAVEYMVGICSESESGVSDQIDVPLKDLNTETSSLQRSPCYPLLEKLVSPLKKGDKEYQDIESKFLRGLREYASDTIITGISRDTSSRGQVRLQAFETLKELTRKSRGDDNERFAWHGTSKAGVSGIFLHGFGQPRIPKNGSAYGVGVYLAPEWQSHVSAIYADDDENGEQHVVLCRVILGASELVGYGSDQFHPSSEQYDTGLDDLVSPRRLIVWSTHMNTHILPLYVVSFRLPPSWHNKLMAAYPGKRATTIHHGPFVKRYCTARQKSQEADETGTGSFCKRGPTSPFSSFPHLFLLLTPLLAPEKLQYLKDCHQEFQAGRLARPQLIQHLRDVVGDHRLMHAIKLLQGSQMSEGKEQMKSKTPLSFTAREKIMCETPMSFTAREVAKCETPMSFTARDMVKCETPRSFAAVNLSSTDSLINIRARTSYETRLQLRPSHLPGLMSSQMRNGATWIAESFADMCPKEVSVLCKRCADQF